MIIERWENDRVTITTTWTDTSPVQCTNVTVEAKPGISLKAQDFRAFPFQMLGARANDTAWQTDPRR